MRASERANENERAHASERVKLAGEQTENDRGREGGRKEGKRGMEGSTAEGTRAVNRAATERGREGGREGERQGTKDGNIPASWWCDGNKNATEAKAGRWEGKGSMEGRTAERTREVNRATTKRRREGGRAR